MATQRMNREELRMVLVDQWDTVTDEPVGSALLLEVSSLEDFRSDARRAMRQPSVWEFLRREEPGAGEFVLIDDAGVSQCDPISVREFLELPVRDLLLQAC